MLRICQNQLLKVGLEPDHLSFTNNLGHRFGVSQSFTVDVSSILSLKAPCGCRRKFINDYFSCLVHACPHLSCINVEHMYI